MSYELRVASYELPVESLKARIEIQKCNFKSTSYEIKSTSFEFKSTSYEFKFTSCKFTFKSYQFKSTSTSSRIIKLMKDQVILHNFIQLSLNSSFAQVQTLLAVCRRFAIVRMVRISDNGPGWK